MSKALAELFKHNLWANMKLLEACAGLEEGVLSASTPGTYGSIADTLTHLIAAEERYVTSLTGRKPESPLRESQGFPGFETLRSRGRRSGGALIEIAERFQPSRVLRGVYQGEPYAMRAVIPLSQAINHATEHRAQVNTILSQQGIQPPEIDVWAYNDETGAD